MPGNLAGFVFGASFPDSRMIFPQYGGVFAPTLCNDCPLRSCDEGFGS